MIEILITVVLEVAKCLAPPLGRRFAHLRNYKANFDNLQEEVGKLKLAKDRVQRKIDEAANNIEEIEPEVKEWQSNVESVIDEAEKLIEDKANNRCFKGLCPNLRKRHKNSKEASRELEVIGKLLQKEERFDKVSYRITPEDIRLTSTKDFEALESRDEILKNIISSLNDGSVRMVGIYGMGGIGKTTLVKEVGRLAKNDQIFDEVVFVEISENQNIKKIQEEIAAGLGLKDLHNKDLESQRANMLYARLKNGKRILLILDNIWGELHLETIGIPAGPDHGGCKLLLTTRNQDLLAIMGSKAFQIGRLGDDEAWKLFKKMAGDYIENRELKSVAVDMVKECGGLPVAIVTVAKALRNKNKFEWDDALEELKRPSLSNITALLKPAYSKIEFSYNKLEGDELKKTFLLCSLMTNNALISDLFDYVMGLEMLDGKTLRLEQARNKLKKWVRQLKDSCLLLDGDYSSACFSMHDVVRDVAVSIACRDQHAFTVRNDDLREWPDKEKLKQCMKISLHDCNILEPLERLECPELEFFYMGTKNNSSLRIPENFFMAMAKLRVLHIPNLRLSSFPSSLCDLVNLQTLCLEFGNFKDVAIIGELKKLKILRLIGSNTTQLPSEIGQLAELRLLDLSYCGQLKVIASNVISSLSRLEELYMRACPVQWEIKGMNVESGNACLEELCQSSQLTTLEIDIEDDKVLPTDFFSKELERYRISIGSGLDYIVEVEWSPRRMLKLKLKSSICLKETQNIKNAEVLCLDQWQGEKDDLLSELDRDGFSQLKHLRLEINHQFRCVVDSMNLVARDAFPALELLYLSNLSNLEKICHGRFTTESFCKLKSIQVYC